MAESLDSITSKLSRRKKVRGRYSALNESRTIKLLRSIRSQLDSSIEYIVSDNGNINLLSIDRNTFHPHHIKQKGDLIKSDNVAHIDQQNNTIYVNKKSQLAFQDSISLQTSKDTKKRFIIKTLENTDHEKLKTLQRFYIEENNISRVHSSYNIGIIGINALMYALTNQVDYENYFENVAKFSFSSISRDLTNALFTQYSKNNSNRPAIASYLANTSSSFKIVKTKRTKNPEFRKSLLSKLKATINPTNINAKDLKTYSSLLYTEIYNTEKDIPNKASDLFNTLSYAGLYGMHFQKTNALEQISFIREIMEDAIELHLGDYYSIRLYEEYQSSIPLSTEQFLPDEQYIRNLDFIEDFLNSLTEEGTAVNTKYKASLENNETINGTIGRIKNDFDILNQIRSNIYGGIDGTFICGLTEISKIATDDLTYEALQERALKRIEELELLLCENKEDIEDLQSKISDKITALEKEDLTNHEKSQILKLKEQYPVKSSYEGLSVINKEINLIGQRIYNDKSDQEDRLYQINNIFVEAIKAHILVPSILKENGKTTTLHVINELKEWLYHNGYEIQITDPTIRNALQKREY